MGRCLLINPYKVFGPRIISVLEDWRTIHKINNNNSTATY